jgi:sec-independent protein translocase protein TatA
MFVGHLPELILVLVLALIFVGPGKLPAVGAALGKSIAQFKKATSEVEEGIRSSVETTTPARREVRTEQHYLTSDGEEVDHVTAETREHSTTS